MELLKYILISIPMISSMTCGSMLLVVFYKNLSVAETPILRTLGGYYGVLIVLWFIDNLTQKTQAIRISLLPIMLLLVCLSQVLFYHFVSFFTPMKKKFNYYHYIQAIFLGIMSYVFLYVLSRTEGFHTLDHQFLLSKSLSTCMGICITYYTFLFWIRVYKYQRGIEHSGKKKLSWIHLLLLGKTVFSVLILSNNKSVWVYTLTVLTMSFQHIVLTFNLLQEKKRIKIPQSYKTNILLSSGQIISVDQTGTQSNDVLESSFVHANDNANNLLTQRDIVAYFTQSKPYTDKNFRLETIVNHFGVNRTYVSKFINVTYHCNVSQFINSWRIKEVEYLQKTDKESNLEHLVVQAGFSDYRHYVRAVKNAEKRQRF
ncbi:MULTISPECIES: helix-turn-helix transcriptional regulator [unclassified Myroides]|uniref:helix-turn-helix transcriptional regulator n=1 Tax=unclassified Myroides TaxID=2642485 RepID=UPI0015F974D7|nr:MULTISPECIES: helix-turn-helix transcriptional regulator [unclassified Myroides]MBB1151215.1 helix-turn-helix transcriptional regulator [Myroides sp. NP-2]MDM1408425.1 helix-turn-helix transcriptional regulator [Myroides sp. DF42-4-2]